jgi:Tfp pilus assembly protein PilO
MKNRVNKKYQIKKASVGFKAPAVLVSILTMFVVATVFFAIEASTLGAKLAQLENEEANLIKERQEFSNQLVNSSSLSIMSEKAEELGFKKPSDVIYVSEKEAVAKLP